MLNTFSYCPVHGWMVCHLAFFVLGNNEVSWCFSPLKPFLSSLYFAIWIGLSDARFRMEWVTWRCCGTLSPSLSSSLLSGSWSPCFALFFVLDMTDEEPHHKTWSSYVHPKASLQVQRHTFPPCAGAPQAQSGGAINHGLGLQNYPSLVIYIDHFAIVMESWLGTLGCSGSMQRNDVCS